jgi:hypothetical protein
MNCEISFTVVIDGREIPPVAFNDAIPAFEGVSITPLENDKGEYRIAISMKEVTSYEYASKQAALTIETLLSALAYHLQCFVGDPRFDVARTIEGKNITIYPPPMIMSVSAHGSFPISAATITELLRNTVCCPYFIMFRHALQIRDELGKFMALYMVLLSVCSEGKGDDKQKYVDEFILERDPQTPYCPNPHNKNKETIFTKLRNQVGHSRGVSLAQTRTEMAQNLSALQAHVFAAIEENCILKSGVNSGNLP